MHQVFTVSASSRDIAVLFPIVRPEEVLNLIKFHATDLLVKTKLLMSLRRL